MLEKDKNYKNQNNEYSLNEDIIKGKWKDVKGGVRKLWGKITDDELEQAKGDLISISGIIQQRYGENKESIKTKMNNLLRGFDDKLEETKTEVNKASDKLKSAVAQATENVKTKLESMISEFSQGR